MMAFLAGWVMLREAKFDLQDAQQHSGQITNRGVGKFFTFTVAGAPATFNIYNPSRNYANLEAALNPGDSVTVYFVNSQTANRQAYQVEKNGQVVVNKELLTGQNRNGGIVAIVGGLGILGGVFWRLRRKKYRFW